MLVFITGVLWFTGKGASPLLNLYLLPIILSALTLGRLVTLLQVAAIAVCHFLLALATPGVEVISLLYASQVVGQLAPFLLVAYLTTTLSADITEARERIENLAQTDSLTGLLQPAHVQRTVAARTQRRGAQSRHVFAAHDRHGQAQGDQRRIRPRSGKQRDHAGGAMSAEKHSQYRSRCAFRRRRIRSAAAGRFARGGGGRDQARSAQRLQDHTGSALAHDPLQRQHRRGQLPARTRATRASF